MGPCDLVGDGDLNAPPDDPVTAAELFSNSGLCIFQDMLPLEVVDSCHAAFVLRSSDIDARLAELGVDLDTQFRFNDVVRRRRARFDIKCGHVPEEQCGKPDGVPVVVDGFSQPALWDAAPWLPFVHEVLGDSAVECWRGVVDNRPGSEVQGWHRDGQPLFDHVHLPAHCLVLFAPLIDVASDALGPTQFYPGSHATFRSHLYCELPEDRCSKPHCTPLLARGSVLCFDFRTIHRGLPNTTSDSRPMLYVIYSKAWFRIEEAEGAFPIDKPLFATGASPSASPDAVAGAAVLATSPITGAMPSPTQLAALSDAAPPVNQASYSMANGHFGPWAPPGSTCRKAASDWAAGCGMGVEGHAFAPHVPTPLLQAKRLCELGAINAADVVCDLGCGEASLLCELVRLTGCAAIGCDVDSDLLASGRANIDADGYCAPRVRLTHAPIETFVQSAAFASATVVFVFLVPSQLAELMPTLAAHLKARHGNRLLSQRYEIGGWQHSAKLMDQRAVQEAGATPAYFGSSLGAAFLYAGRASC